jgi:D-alanyl-D-alanine carboxypeptidase
MTTRTLALVVAVACSFGGTAASATNLKPFDAVALRDTVEATAKELMLPGTMVLLRTPQGEFVFATGRRSWAARRRREPIRILGLPRIPRR